MNNLIENIKYFIHYCLDGKKRKFKIDNFLKRFFNSKRKKLIIQVGGNDGINSDPLRKYFKKKGNYRAIIIEPLDYYFKSLKKLYRGRSDIMIKKFAISNNRKKQNIYFIDPSIATKLNGDGPKNNWAHGQGSFDKRIVKYWIIKNSFRGKDYRNNIPLYINSIKKNTIITKKLSDFGFTKNLETLLVIDVQGFELEVIESMNWSNSPKYIIYEDDIKLFKFKSNKIRKILKDNNYKYIGGKYDKLFSKEN